LSQGTVDQVYLAARLGLVRLVTGDRRPPLLFDDPFVTFDDQRARRSFDLLRTLAADFQVIYFTTSDRYDDAAEVVIELLGPDGRDVEADRELEREAAEQEKALVQRLATWPAPPPASLDGDGDDELPEDSASEAPVDPFAVASTAWTDGFGPAQAEPVTDREAAAAWADEGGSVATVAEVQQDAPESVDSDEGAQAGVTVPQAAESGAAADAGHEWWRRAEVADDDAPLSSNRGD
jgi:hypothetical protein